jgi:hypothetical protein
MIPHRETSSPFPGLWSPFVPGLAVVALLVVGWAVPPKAVAQTEGPITAPSTQSAPPSAQQAPVQPAATPNLAGKWKLNRDQSDDPREKMREALGNTGNRGGGRQRGLGGRPGAGGLGQRRPLQGPMDLADLSQLTIAQSEDMTKVSGASGRVLALYSAAHSASPQPSGKGSYTPPAAKWQDNQLVVATEGARGGKTTRAYSLSPDGNQLYLTIRSENQRFREPLTIRFVYDRAKDTSS